MNSRGNYATPPKAPGLFPLWVEDRGLSFLLGFLLLIVIFVPMVPLSRYGRIGLGLIFALMVFSGAIATIRHRILMYLVIALTVLEFTADLIVEFKPSLGRLGLGHCAQNLRPRHLGDYDVKAHVSPGSD